MSGMLPGVECARRRRLNRNSPGATSHEWSRKSFFCLYTSNHEAVSYNASISSLERSLSSQGDEGEELGGVAKEAKERLDERFRNQRRSKDRRQTSPSSFRLADNKPILTSTGEMRTEVLSTEKNGYKRFNWVRLRC